MPLSILTRLRDGRYDAGGTRPDQAEWPPHPGRVFCALVASATGEQDWEALRWLEAAGPPQVWAAEEFDTVRRDGYVVTNTIDRNARSQHHLARTNGLRTRFSAEPADPHFALVWPHAQPAPGTVWALTGLARRVPYLGRTTSPVTLQVHDHTIAERPQWTRFTPASGGTAAAAWLRVPYAGYTDQLRDAYAHGRRAWEVARTVPYTRPHSAPAPRAHAAPFSDLLVLPLARGSTRPAADRLLAVTSLLRAAVLARIGTDVPPQISGHGADAHRHVAYLALPHVGHPHADGRILAAALAIPADLPADAYTRLWQAIDEPPLDRLTLRRDRPLHLEPLAATPTTWAATPERWTAADTGGARTWVTATPMMLDRFPGRRRGDEAIINEISHSLTRAGYPPPAQWRFSPAAMLDGALHRPRPDTIPAHRPRKPMVHVHLTFDQPVTGPVLAGAMRYCGLGLFAPAPATPHQATLEAP